MCFHWLERLVYLTVYNEVKHFKRDSFTLCVCVVVAHVCKCCTTAQALHMRILHKCASVLRGIGSRAFVSCLRWGLESGVNPYKAYIIRTWIWSIGYIMDTFLSEVFLWICSGYVCPRVHVFVWVQVYVCLQAWRTALSLWLQSAGAVHLVLWNRISHWLETWLVCLAVDSKIPSVSGCPARNTEVCTTMPASFMLVLGIEHRESFMLARQASYCQSHTRDLGVSFPCWTIFCLAPMWLMVYWDPVYLLE